MPFFKDNFKDLNICDIYQTLVSFPVYVSFRIVKFMLYLFSLLSHAFLLYLSLFIKNNMIKKICCKYYHSREGGGMINNIYYVCLFVPKEARNDNEDF